MKRQKPPGNRPVPPTDPAGPASTVRSIPVARRWLFRAGAFLLPLLVLVLLEAALRLGGYGYPTAFFRSAGFGGETRLVNSDSFSLRFFPAEMARFASPIQISARKPAGVFRIFVFGESAAMGDPEPAFGASRYLEALLAERYPESRFEVVNVAFTAINSHVILPIARECAGLEGDLWIIYMGNNEMVGPYGPATVFGAQAPPLSFIRVGLALQKTRLGQALMALARRLRGGNAGATWGGMEMFAQNRVPPGDRRRGVVRRHFERNLRDIIGTARSAGANVILSTMAVNLKDCAPFASETNAAPDARAALANVCRDAVRALGQGQFAVAASNWTEAVRLDPDSADNQFQLGASLVQAGSLAPAREAFQAACDLDALPFRADSKLNQVIREQGVQMDAAHCALSDAAASLATNGVAGVCGRESFYEHVHLNFDGNYRLARLWAEQVERWLPSAATNRAPAGWPSQAACEERLGLTDWGRAYVLQTVLRRLDQPPLNGLANHAQEVAAFQEELRQVSARLTPTNAVLARAAFGRALARAPSDHWLYENYGEFLESIGDLQAAAVQWRTARDLMPEYFLPHFQVGRLAALQRQWGDAETSLRRALALRAGLAEAWFELGSLHAAQDGFVAALAEYEQACRLRPRDPTYHSYRARALGKLGRHGDAIAALRRAVELQPAYWEAHLLLGDELAAAGQGADARLSYEAVARLNPRNTLAHLNLGVLAAQEQRLDDALFQFAEVLRLDPNNATAREYQTRVQAFKARRVAPR